MIYSADSAAGGVHLIKANNEDILRLYSTGIIAHKTLNTYAGIISNGILSNSPSSSFYVGGGNAFDGTAITNPRVVNGIATGTGDGYSNQYLIMQSIHGGGQDLLIHGLKLAKQQLIIVMVIFIRLDF